MTGKTEPDISMEAAALRQQSDTFAGYLAKDPDNIHLIHRNADLCLQRGDLGAAHKLVNHGLRLQPGNSALEFLLSSIEMAANRPDAAVHILKGLLARGIDNASVRYNLGYALGLTGQMEKAKDILAESIGRNYVELPITNILLARLYHHLGNTEEAIRCLMHFLQDDPEHTEANGYLALIYADVEDFAAAAKYASKANAQGSGSSVEACLAMGMVQLDESEPEQALRFFSSACELKKNSGRAWLGKGLGLMMTGDLAGAEENLSMALKLMPSHLGTWLALAWAQIAQQKLADAGETLDRAMSMDRNFSEIHGTLAVICLLKEDIPGAQTLIRRAQMLDPDSFSAAYASSLLLAYQGEAGKAQLVIRQQMNLPIGKQGDTLQSRLNRFVMKRKSESRLM